MRCYVNAHDRSFMGTNLRQTLKAQGHDLVRSTQQPEWVFHLATKEHGRYDEIMVHNYYAAVDFLEEMIHHNPACRSFINIGTSLELFYDNSYAFTKSMFTKYCSGKNFPITSLLPYSVYGPYQATNKLIPVALNCRRIGGIIPAPEDLFLAHDFVHVQDVCDAMIYAAENQYRGVFDVGTGVQTTLLELFNMLGVRSSPGAYEQQPWDSREWVAKNFMPGWKAKIDLRTGLEMTEKHFWRETVAMDYVS